MLEGLDAEPFPFMQLPRELRLEVLKHSDLVDSRYGSEFHQSIGVCDGRLQINPWHGTMAYEHKSRPLCKYCEYPISNALMRVNKQLYYEAREIFLGYNRIILMDGHVKNLEFLKKLSSKERMLIRRLDLYFNDDIDFADEPDVWCCVISNPQYWEALIDFIANNLNLSQLQLSIDLGTMYMDLCDNPYYDQINAAFSHRAMLRLAKPLAKLHHIKRLHVFLPWHTPLETVMEQMAKGKEYDSINDGKVPANVRHDTTPHFHPSREDLKSRRKHGWGIMDCTAKGNVLVRHSWHPPTRRKELAAQMIDDDLGDCTHPEWWVGMQKPTIAP